MANDHTKRRLAWGRSDLSYLKHTWEPGETSFFTSFQVDLYVIEFREYGLTLATGTRWGSANVVLVSWVNSLVTGWHKAALRRYKSDTTGERTIGSSSL